MYRHPFEFDRYQEMRRGEYKQEVTFATCVRDYMGKVEDIIIADPTSKKINIEIMIDILTDQGQQQDTLQLWALKALQKEGRRQMDEDVLLRQMTSLIKRLQIKDNVNKWWQSFKRGGNGGGKNSFQIKKIKEHMEKMDGLPSIPYEQELVFKNRNDWTYNELFKSCQ